MKKAIILIIAILSTSSIVFSQTKAGRVEAKRQVEYYTCPMHPDVVSHKAGKCPKCGEKLNLSLKEQMKMEETRNYTCAMHPEVTRHDPAKCPKCGQKLNLSPKEQMKAEVMKIYTCPMHPQVALDKDGKCPKCGKDLVEKKQKTI